MKKLALVIILMFLGFILFGCGPGVVPPSKDGIDLDAIGYSDTTYIAYGEHFRSDEELFLTQLFTQEQKKEISSWLDEIKSTKIVFLLFKYSNQDDYIYVGSNKRKHFDNNNYPSCMVFESQILDFDLIMDELKNISGIDVFEDYIMRGSETGIFYSGSVVLDRPYYDPKTGEKLIDRPLKLVFQYVGPPTIITFDIIIPFQLK